METGDAAKDAGRGKELYPFDPFISLALTINIFLKHKKAL